MDKQEELKSRLYKNFKPGIRLPALPPRQFVPKKASQNILQKSAPARAPTRLVPIIREDDFDIIAYVNNWRNSKADEFAYLCPRYPQSDHRYNPYDLRPKDFSNITPTDYYTISHRGLVHFFKGTAEFISISKWIEDHQRYNKLKQLKFFSHFRLKKSLNSWKHTITQKKVNQAQALLNKNLFQFDPLLRDSLIVLREKCSSLYETEWVHLAAETYSLSGFKDTQRAHQERFLLPKISRFHEEMMDILYACCEKVLKDQGFLEDETASVQTSNVKRLTYTQQAAKRNSCRRLQRFAKLVDYFIVGTVHQSVLNTLRSLEERLAGSGEVPLFKTELLMDANKFQFSPKCADFKSVVDYVLKSLIELVKGMKLVSESVEIIQTNEDEKPESISIAGVITSDVLWISHCSSFRKSIDKLFGLAEDFIVQLEKFRVLFGENAAADFKWIVFADSVPVTTVDKYLEYFEKSFSSYTDQTIEIEKLSDNVALSQLELILTQFKDTMRPSPRACLQAISKLLPELASALCSRMTGMFKETVQILTTSPDSVDNYARYLAHLSTAKDSLEEREKYLEQIHKAYHIIYQYACHVELLHQKEYDGLVTLHKQMKEAVENAEQLRGEVLKKFSIELEKRVNELLQNSVQLKMKAMDPALSNAKYSPEEILPIVEELASSMEDMSKLATKFENFDREFQLSIPKRPDVEEVKSEIMLKRNLWRSMDQWDRLVVSWKTCQFDQLKTEDMQQQINQFVKTAYMLDKGLPPNDVVPRLKKSIDEFNSLYPLIVDLRNPNLKTRHWDKLQDIIGKPIVRDSTFTLDKLFAMNLIAYREQINNVSGQASNEATLEEMLGKVAKAWADTEFSILPYRDYKDVFILGAMDDLQAQLEDSLVTIATIKGSKFIGPIKNDVERWDRQLSIFSETLDAWIACQRNWMYMESIFNSPDIQRQLPDEAKMFAQVDRSWKEIMRKTYCNPNAIKAATTTGLLETMVQNNALLETVQKCLEDYLESKRLLFPRFYFLSNDELLDILAQARNPLAVQPHLNKCFDAVKSLEFSAEQKSTDILAIISAEGERLPFVKTLKARGNVETWLSLVEDGMFSSVRKYIKQALLDYDEGKRSKWLLQHCGQAVLTVSMLLWTQGVTEALLKEDPVMNLINFKRKCVANLSQVAVLVRGNLTKLQRAVLSALITLEVHARDITQNLIDAKITSVIDFDWLKQLRYSWDAETEDIFVKMLNNSFKYGYEYLGCSSRLVITPLTDRCYLTLTNALSLNLGGSPLGPAGTGKTETVKDLSRSLARICIIMNCSSTFDYKMMGKMFAGLAQSGAWCCFDEFNRIDIEVLSVVAQQLLSIKNAKDANATRFVLEGREIRLIPTCAAFVTMNPGYAGRTELPDNLKALFRPIAMMIPDYGLIAEIILFSEGFENAKELAAKVVNLYKLCNEQLSRQDHYDFGMRAVKSVLVMAGLMKRASPNDREEIVLIRALRDSNLPKFLADDIPLFKGILADLFPGVVVADTGNQDLIQMVERIFDERKLTKVPAFISRVMQLYDTMKIRHGVMLVGHAGGGKTTCYEVLAEALSRLRDENNSNQDFQRVKRFVINPKSISLTELYGEYNLATMEWKDGLMGTIIRSQVTDSSPDEKWTICDGPVDALWIEDMNSVLDDNKLLCLANGERIKFNSTMKMMFEVADLAVASPATVSRCGMVYIDPSVLGWRASAERWFKCLPYEISQASVEHLRYLFDVTVDKALFFVRKSTKEYIPTTNTNLVGTLTRLLTALFNPADELKLEEQDGKSYLNAMYMFAFTWAFGGNLVESCHEAFDAFCKELFAAVAGFKLPDDSVFDYYVDKKTRSFVKWENIVPPFTYSNSMAYFDILVPTVDTVRFNYLLDLMNKNNFPVLLGGVTGVGKSVIIENFLKQQAAQGKVLPLTINFSAQTTSLLTQQTIELRLEKKRKNLLAPSGDARMVLFVDDLNMPKLDTFGSQPPIELLRQLIDFHGFYDREKLFWKSVEGVSFIASCAPPGGGRSSVTARLLRHFSLFQVPKPSDKTLFKIFKTILDGFFKPFSQDVKSAADAVVNSSIEVFNRILAEVLPTPAKSHYTFNLRDLSKVIQGMLQARPNTLANRGEVAQLFCHEASRVFHDRLINEQDREYFNGVLAETIQKMFNLQLTPQSIKGLVFGDLMKRGSSRDERQYVEISDAKSLTKALEEYQEDFNASKNQDMRLIFFQSAREHLLRIVRILRQPRGNCLLVGVSGTGKQSLAKLAAHVVEYDCKSIELTRTYGVTEWKEDLKALYLATGVDNKPTVFLLTDAHIKSESFLEDINNLLNSGEVPNLFEPDERERILSNVRPQAREKGVGEDRDSVHRFFINRVRDNLHVVLASSPVGSAFRNRCRMFPSLVNCCTIDWFDEWPQEALLSVAQRMLEFVDLGSNEMREKIPNACVLVHSSVGEIAKKFYSELKRYYYTTPTSYLELISLYISMLQVKRKELGMQREKLRNGLKKLAETNEMVAKMQVELEAFGPVLIQKSADVEALMVRVKQDQENADAVKTVVEKEEVIVKERAAQTEAIAAEAQRDLDEALPALEAAYSALDALDKKDISEMKAFAKPPELVVTVMEAVCVLFKVKPDWDSSKKLLGDAQFLKKLAEYDKDNIPEPVIKKLTKYTEMPQFQPDVVEKVSRAAKSLCMWVRAMDIYSRVFKEVEPKRRRLEDAQKSLDETRQALKEKQDSLKEIESKLSDLKRQFDDSIKEKQDLAFKTEQTKIKLERASKLSTALKDEQVRWTESEAQIGDLMDGLVGNIFLCASCVAYFGAFTFKYRQELLKKWLGYCKELEIPVSNNFNFTDILADQATLRNWIQQGLPSDSVSAENAIFVTQGRKWPLIIDPQGQANRWIRKMEPKIKALKMSDPKFLRYLENSIRTGQPVLIEDVGETLDPVLEPLLLKQIMRQSGRLLVKLGDTMVDYDKNFKLYMTSKLPNPHFLPEIWIKVCIINFTVTQSGLEEQLLADVVKLERPDIESERDRLVTNLARDKQTLKDLEEKILRLLNAASGRILDDEELINTLNQSKLTSSQIMERVKQAEETQVRITEARDKFRQVAARGTVLYFVLANLPELDPMYQCSLQYFKNLFSSVIQKTPKHESFDEHLRCLNENITRQAYASVSRGLFEKHKVLFSFMITSAILRQLDVIGTLEWQFFLRGASIVVIDEKEFAEKQKAKPFEHISESIWKSIVELSLALPIFKDLCENRDMLEVALQVASDPIASFTLETGDANIGDFHKLLLIKTLKPEALIPAIQRFIERNMASVSQAATFDLNQLFTRETSMSCPMIYILSTGSDPVSTLLKYTREKEQTVHIVSLGQGQGVVAEKLLKRAVVEGEWVFLQNCHLAQSFMQKLELFVKDLQTVEEHQRIGLTEEPPELTSGIIHQTVHPNFRLILSSMPSRVFPISVLQDSCKVTHEPPRGLKSNIMRSLTDSIQSAEFERESPTFKKLFFSLCMFNALIHERKKFGAIGWTVQYDWSNADLEVSVKTIQQILSESPDIEKIDWKALLYLTGEINYGGRVTDEWDRRLLRNTLGKFYSKKVLLNHEHKFTPSGHYYVPAAKLINEFKHFIEDKIPSADQLELFGLDQNAEVRFQVQESQKFIKDLLDVEPRVVVASSAAGNDVNLVRANVLLQKIPAPVDLDSAQSAETNPIAGKLFKRDEIGRLENSLSTVLLQEAARLNKLLKHLQRTLDQLIRAIKGLTLMNEELEEIDRSLSNNSVPSSWATVAYPSVKPLNLWVDDLLKRYEFIYNWFYQGQPDSFWMSGLFFPQGFLTAVLQNHARKYSIAIDQLSFRFEFGDDSTAQDGVLIRGLSLEGALWDGKALSEPKPMEMMSKMPAIRFIPTNVPQSQDGLYTCPLYMTPARAGTLSSTGLSTNFVTSVKIPTTRPVEEWIERGVALILSPADE